MTMQTWDPVRDFRRMEDTMNRLWRTIGNGDGQPEAWTIPLDVAQKGDDYMIFASLPGVDPKDLEVYIEDNVLTIKAQTREPEASDDWKFLMRERRVGTFHRALRLPDTVDTEKVSPHFQNGILKITIPKAEAKKARKLTVQVGNNGSNVIQG